jgi:putative transcriptional regulator
MVKKLDKDMLKFQEDLLQSVRQMKAGKAVRTTMVTLTAAADARAKVGVSQSEFATLLGVSVRTLQDWEQGRREPSGAAKTLLRIAASTPEAIRLVA